MFTLSVPLAHSQNNKRHPIFTDEGTQGCLVCHSGEKINTIQTGVHGADNPMTRRGCEDCHGPGSFHVSRAHGGKGFPSMVRFGEGPEASPRDDQVRACLACHAPDAEGERAVVFASSAHDWALLSCTTCHSLHTETDRMMDKEGQNATCYRCHDERKVEHPRFKDTTITFEDLKCSTCHNVHRLAARSR